MPRIITNLFKNLTESEKEEIKRIGKEFGEIGLYEYIQKSIELEKIIKFIFDGFVLKNLVRDALLWDSFKLLLQKVFLIAGKKSNKPQGIQVWIKDTTNPAVINIAFSIKKKEELSSLMVTLREKLTTSVFSVNQDQEKGKIIWMGFDRENKVWTIQVL